MHQGSDVVATGAVRRPRRGGARRAAVLAGALVAALSLVALGCSDDGGDDGGDADATTTTEVEQTTTTLSDEEFDARVADFNEAVAAAGTDLCEVYRVGNETPPPAPATSDQVRVAVEEYFVPLLRALAETVPDEPAAADPFRTAADELAAEAEAAGYPADFFATGEGQGPESLTNQAFLDANQVFAGLVQERCLGPGAPGADGTDGPDTTIPEG